MTRKSCPYCYSTNIYKHGHTEKGCQRYLCMDCKKSWSNQRKLEYCHHKLWSEYVLDGASAKVLARRYGISRNTISHQLHNCSKVYLSVVKQPRSVVLALDVTYFSGFGILVALDLNADSEHHEASVPYFAEVYGTETTLDYEIAIDSLLSSGFTIKAVVIDGRRDIRQLIESYDIPFNTVSFISY